jgi:zinc protease
MTGQSSREDLERLFELTHLSYTAPRFDDKGLQLYATSRAEALRNRLQAPETHLGDTFSRLMWQGFPRYEPWTVDTLDRLDLAASRAFIQQRFANAGDFTFAIAGSFTLDEIEPLVTTYLASLPGQPGQAEGPTDLGARRNRGVAKEVIERGIDPQSSVRFTLHGSFENVREDRYLLDAMTDILSVRLREELREELGGTYSVGAGAGVREAPVVDYTISIGFQCDPERVDALTARMFEIIKEVQSAPVDAKYVRQVQEQQRRQREISVRDNGFWASMLLAYHQRGEPLELITDYDSLVDGLSPERIHQAAQRWLSLDEYVLVTLMPESGAGAGVAARRAD